VEPQEFQEGNCKVDKLSKTEEWAMPFSKDPKVLLPLLLLAYSDAARYLFFPSCGLAWSTTCGSVSSLQVGGQSTQISLHIARRSLTTLLEKGELGGSLATVEWPWPSLLTGRPPSKGTWLKTMHIMVTTRCSIHSWKSGRISLYVFHA